MTYEVKTAVFEGPLDLLLQLITSHQVEITELSLASLVAEYLAYLEAMQELDLDVTSEFLLIAATLIQLKARRLLPDDTEIDLDEELALAEERDRLLARLLACLTFKDVAAVLSHRFDSGDRFVARVAGLDPDIRPAPPEVQLPIGAVELAQLAHRVFSRVPERPELEHLDLDLPSVDLAIDDIRRRVADAVTTDFDAIVGHCTRRIEVAAYFLALLELTRWGLLEVTQGERDAPIQIRHRPDGARTEFVSEWSNE